LIPDAPVLIVAGGARAWREIESTPRSRTIGYVPRKDLPTLYSLCNAFVFPSLAEGFGLPVLEALACGAPVVTSAHVPLPNLESIAALCDPLDPGSIADQLRRVLDDKELREQLRVAGKQYARPFTWRLAAEQTLEIYRETM
jgi:glycosyltransferase involved in cell wall biosynthesis